MNKITISWVAQVIVVVILGQTLFFKFSDAPETVELFSILGLGAVAYKTIGILELIACVLLLIRPTIVYGALLSSGLMAGAIMAHITRIGFSGPNLSLGSLAILAFLLSVSVLYIRRDHVPVLAGLLRRIGARNHVGSHS